MHEEWQEKPEDEELTIWEDNWDDDNIEDDFCQQLKWVFFWLITACQLILHLFYQSWTRETKIGFNREYAVRVETSWAPATWKMSSAEKEEAKSHSERWNGCMTCMTWF